AENVTDSQESTKKIKWADFRLLQAKCIQKARCFPSSVTDHAGMLDSPPDFNASSARLGDAVYYEASPFGFHPDRFGLLGITAARSWTADRCGPEHAARRTSPTCFDNAAG